MFHPPHQNKFCHWLISLHFSFPGFVLLIYSWTVMLISSSVLCSLNYFRVITPEGCRTDLASCIWAAWGEPLLTTAMIFLPQTAERTNAGLNSFSWIWALLCVWRELLVWLRTFSFGWTQAFWTFWQEMAWIVFSGCLTKNSEEFKRNEENSLK